MQIFEGCSAIDVMFNHDLRVILFYSDLFVQLMFAVSPIDQTDSKRNFLAISGCVFLSARDADNFDIHRCVF